MPSPWGGGRGRARRFLGLFPKLLRQVLLVFGVAPPCWDPAFLIALISAQRRGPAVALRADALGEDGGHRRPDPLDPGQRVAILNFSFVPENSCWMLLVNLR